MLTMKADYLTIMLRKDTTRLSSYKRIGIAKQSEHTLLLLFVDSRKALSGYLLILLNKALRHDDVLNAVFTRVLEGLLSQHAMLCHCVTHEECRIDQYTVIAIKHLGIHAAHGCSYYEIRILLLALFTQKSHRLLRMERQVVSQYIRRRKHLPDTCHRA